jgi:hypothetical protein
MQVHMHQLLDLQELRHEASLLREPGSGTRAVAERMFRNHLFTLLKQPLREVMKRSNMSHGAHGIDVLSLHPLSHELRSREIVRVMRSAHRSTAYGISFT